MALMIFENFLTYKDFAISIHGNCLKIAKKL